MRVIAGTARRIQLETVKGNNTRPTTDRIKETLFNIINNDLYDIDFLDLFSGSGAIGIEALSRGASSATFVENNRNAIGIELKKEFYDLANVERFNKWDDSVYETEDSIEKMKERFNEQLLIGKEQSARGKAEKEEQKLLRAEYIESIRRNLRSQLDNIDIQEKDGSIVNLGERYGRKKGN